MSSKKSGIGFGTIIWGIILYNIFLGGDDDDDEKKPIDVDTDPSFKVKIETKIKEIKDDPKIQELIDEAKKEFDELKTVVVAEAEKAKEGTTEKANESTTEKPINDTAEKPKDDNEQFADNNDDLYGSTEDKW